MVEFEETTMAGMVGLGIGTMPTFAKTYDGSSIQRDRLEKDA